MKRIVVVQAHHAPLHWIVLISGKLFYLFYMILIPVYFFAFISIALMIITHDTYFYWTHRLLLTR